jgi:hypothetical protein
MVGAEIVEIVAGDRLRDNGRAGRLISDLNGASSCAIEPARVAKGDRQERKTMFDQIDAAYYRMRADEEREKATDTDAHEADRHRIRAALFDRRANALAGSLARLNAM